MKKIAALFLSGMMLFSLAQPAFAFSWFKTVAAETYEGKVITMEAQEGEVEVENSAGRSLTLREGSKLYNGYEVYTEDGYVWLVLDDNGVLKMDLDTEIKIEKNGSNLEIILVEGEVFFNITEDFDDDETFTITTSTMTTGIRGTSGIVSTRTREDTTTEFSIKLLEGSVELTYLVDNASDTYLAQELTSGRTFWLTSDAQGENEEGASKTYQSNLSDLSADAINGFAAVEIQDSTDLQDKILEAQGVIDDDMMQEIVAAADTKLEEDEQLRDSMQETTTTAQEEAFETLQELAQQVAQEPEAVATPVPTAVPSATPVATEQPEETVEDTTVVVTTATATVAPTAVPTAVPTATPTEITVTYQYDSATFATQVVAFNTVPTTPYLQPTASGYWAKDGVQYDFTTALTADTTLTWVSVTTIN